jgi:hypothetical protein
MINLIDLKVPLVPWVPVLSIFVNFYLMLKLSTMTWIRFGVWMIIGLSIYAFYGVWNSNERNVNKQPVVKYQTKNNSVAINN